MTRKTENTIVTIVFTIFVIFALSILALMYHKQNIDNISINYGIDSLKQENKKIIIEVNNLDSIKDAKIIEVKALDDDSTIKLFYELISEQ